MNSIYTKVDPQPQGLDYLWPNPDSHIEWWDVQEDANYFGHCYLRDIDPDDTVTVKREDDGSWWWVITKSSPKARQ